MIPYLRAANVKNGELSLDDVLAMNFSPSEQEKFRLRGGDVLVTEGCGSLAQIGASARWNEEIAGPVCFQNTLLRLRAIDGLTDPEFVYQWARWAFETGAFAETATGTSIFHIGAQRAAEMPFPDVLLKEQQRIADLLRNVDRQLDLSAVESGSAARVVDALRRQLTDSTGKDPKPLSYFLKTIEGGRSLATLQRPPQSGERAVLKISAVKPALFVASEAKALPEDAVMPPRAIVRVGDVLMTRANTAELVGAVCRVTEPCDGLYLSDKTLRLVFDEDKVDPDYFVHALATPSVRHQLALAATGTSGSMKNVSQDKIRSLLVRAPEDVAEQRRLADTFEDALALVRRADERTTSLRKLRSSLSRLLLSGEHEIPASYDHYLSNDGAAPEPEPATV